MAIDPWIYASGAPPAASSPPYRAKKNVQSKQGFATFLRSSLDQAVAVRSASRTSVKDQTSSGPHIVRGQVDLAARPVFSTETQGAQSKVGEASVADQAASTDAQGSQSKARETPVAEQAVSTGSEQQAAKGTAPFTAEEESVLRAVAALQARSVKSSSTKPHVRTAAKTVDDTEQSAATEEASDSGPTVANLDELAKHAKSQVGKRYILGGSSPKSGFDCSGFTNWVYSESGVDIARNSRAQFQEGTPVSRDKLQKGDLVFFGKKRVHHVGLYLGDGQFIHSTSSGGTVRISSLDNPVWSRSYAGARRVVVQSAGRDGQKQG